MTITGLKMNSLIDYLDEILPDATCSLNYNKDYELLIAVMLSAQTTDKRVNEVTSVLFKKYDSLNKLKGANIEDIKVIIYSLGSYNKKALNIKNIASRLANIGYVPNDRKFLESLDGVGRKTTNVVLSVLYNEPYMAVDTHIERISKRLGFAKKTDNVRVVEEKLIKLIPKDRVSKIHHQFIQFGRNYCKARNPLCNTCKLKDMCKYKKL